MWDGSFTKCLPIFFPPEGKLLRGSANYFSSLGLYVKEVLDIFNKLFNDGDILLFFSSMAVYSPFTWLTTSSETHFSMSEFLLIPLARHSPVTKDSY